jgi:enoyl-CoA hydratase
MPLSTFDLRETTAVVTMNDGKANALSFAMMDEVDAALERARREASAVVLVGRPGRFCAGFDLAEMMAGPARARAMIARGAEFLLGLYLFPMPLIVACSGHALAGGALVVLTGDVRVAARGPFRIGLNEVQIGLPVPILAMELARDRLHPSELTGATLFSQIVDPEQALRAGWIDSLTAPEGLVDAAVREAVRLAALPRDPYAKTKVSLRGRTVSYVRATLAEDLERLLAPPAP